MTREEVLRQEIDKYRRKIETYQSMISEWEIELGITPGTSHSHLPANPMTKGKDSSAGDPLSLIQGMIFYNKSQAEAAKAFLEMVGYPLKTELILEGIERGGITVGGKTPTAKKQNLYTILHRSSEFALVKKDTWGLTSWPGVTKKSAEEADDVEGSNGSEDPKKATANESKPS